MYSVKRSVVPLSLLAALTFVSGVNAQTIDPPAAGTNIQSSKDQLAAQEELLLAPSPEDKAKYEQFLKLPDTGLCKVVPREKMQDRAIRGRGSNYSFVRLNHEYGFGSEIGLEDGKLYTSFGGDDLGFISSIGDVAIDSVDLKQPGADFLSGYTVPQDEAAAKEEQQHLLDGVEGGGYVFHRSAAANINTTYVMRAIEYGRADVLAVFRVVGQNTDGSLTILWRILQRNPTPQVIQSEQ
ncbi:MAG: hypothetical protein ACREDR_22865 [Blastocatellia bacterium]